MIKFYVTKHFRQKCIGVPQNIYFHYKLRCAFILTGFYFCILFLHWNTERQDHEGSCKISEESPRLCILKGALHI